MKMHKSKVLLSANLSLRLFLMLLLAMSCSVSAGANRAHYYESKNADILMRSGADEKWEECFSFKQDEVVDYFLRTPQPLNFNIHYHEEDGVKYPKKTIVENEFKSVFVVPSTGTFCFMWGNTAQRDTSFVVHFEFAIRKQKL